MLPQRQGGFFFACFMGVFTITEPAQGDSECTRSGLRGQMTEEMAQFQCLMEYAGPTNSCMEKRRISLPTQALLN